MNKLDKQFMWKMRGDSGFVAVSDMRTSHLFYTLRMIWNNFMPPEMRVGEVKLYAFGVYYTKPYLRQAIACMGRELADRPDIPVWMQKQLGEMSDHLNKTLGMKNELLPFNYQR